MNRKFSRVSLGAPSFPRFLRKGWETANLERNPRTERQRNGFTLMELLIVISIIVILMLIAIPTSRTIKKKANELSAQKSLQTIEQGESMYETTYPVNGFACTLPALAGDPASGPPSPAAAQVINGELATAISDG